MDRLTHELDIKSLYHSLFRKIKYFVVSFLFVALVIAAAASYSMYLNPSFVSSTKIYVDLQNTAGQSITATELTQMKEMTNTFLQIIESNRLADKVISKLKLDISPESFLSGSLSVSTIESTPFIQISATWKDANTAYAINSAVVESTNTVLQEMGISGSLRIVDGPTTPQQQNIPSKPIMIIFLILGGLILGFICVLLNELLYKGIRTEEDVKVLLNLENLGVIPVKKK